MTDYTVMCKKCKSFPVQVNDKCVICNDEELQRVAKVYTEKELIDMVKRDLSLLSIHIRALGRKDSKHSDMTINVMDEILDIHRIMDRMQ